MPDQDIQTLQANFYVEWFHCFSSLQFSYSDEIHAASILSSGVVISMHELKRIVGLQNDAFDLHIAKISTNLCENLRLSNWK